MGIFSRIQKRKQMKILTNSFKVLNNYSPAFSTFNGGIYEMELTRSTINSIAMHCSKLNPVCKGNYRHKDLIRLIQTKPNYLMTTQQFLLKLFTILLCENNAFIVPIYENYSADKIVGFYPVRSSGSRIVESDGIDYLIYKINNEEYVCEYNSVGHLRNHFYSKEYIGESNEVCTPTLDLINTQNQGIKEGIKQSASIRFLARLTNTLLPEHLKKEQKVLREQNLSIENTGGVMLFDNKYSDVREIKSEPFIVDKEQMDFIKTNVFNYFHVSEKIVQNSANEDEWNAFYEGCIEPFALQLSQVFTAMLFDEKDISKGYGIHFETSKIEFASNKTKLEFATQMFDRGQLTTNQSLAIFNLPPVPDGDKRYIRKEYTEVNNLDKEVVE